MNFARVPVKLSKLKSNGMKKKEKKHCLPSKGICEPAITKNHIFPHNFIPRNTAINDRFLFASPARNSKTKHTKISTRIHLRRLCPSFLSKKQEQNSFFLQNNSKPCLYLLGSKSDIPYGQEGCNFLLHSCFPYQ